MSADPTHSYLRSTVLTAPPEQLHLMLIDGAIRFALQAKDALQARQFETFCDKLSRASAIIVEMQLGLKPEIQPELCDRMKALYNFIYRMFVKASVEKDPRRIDDAVRVLRSQRDTWSLIVNKVAEVRKGDEGAGRALELSATGTSLDPGSGGLNLEG